MTTNVSKNRRILQNSLWYGGFWLLFALWLRLCVPESIMGWERHQLFRYAADYLNVFYTTAYPILYYVQAFFTQFYLYPLLGAGVIGGLLVLGMGAWHRLTGQRWPGAVWAALMLPLIPYFNLLWLLTWLILLLGALCISRLVAWRGWLRYSLLVVLGLLGALLLVENAIWMVVFWAVVYGCLRRSWRDGLCALGLLGLGAALGIGLLFWKGYPYYYAPYFSHFVLLKAHYRADAFPAIFFKCPLFIKMVSYVALGVGLLLSCVVLFSPTGKEGDKAAPSGANKNDEEQVSSAENNVAPASEKANRKRCLMQGGIGVMIAALFVYAGYLNLRYQMEDFYLVYRLNAEQRYFEATAVAETALFEREQTEQANRRLRHFSHRRPQQATTLAAKLGVKPVVFQHQLEKEYIADALRIALLSDKQATERLFFYSGLGYFPLLFTGNIFLKPAQHFVALYYTQNGFYAEALHLLYDCITTGHVSKTVVESLLWNSVVVKDYAPCRKFIRLFEQTLFHQDIARRYTAYLADTAATDRQPEIATARLRLSNRNHTVKAYNPDDNIHFRLRRETTQAPTYEYALSLWMIYKNHPQILAELPKIRQYYPRLPRHVQEAVLANFSLDRIDEAPEDIDPETKGLYAYFIQTYEAYMNGYASLQLLEKNFGDTYWFYLNFGKKQSTNASSDSDESDEKDIITRQGSNHQI